MTRSFIESAVFDAPSFFRAGIMPSKTPPFLYRDIVTILLVERTHQCVSILLDDYSGDRDQEIDSIVDIIIFV